MPEKSGPSSIAVRMYNVGFGDCFLLTFRYPAAAKIPERHMLIDFGSSAAPRYGPKDYLQRVADDIARQSKGKLHVVAATHRHRDHINGFATNGGGSGKVIAALRPDHVILPWTEDPNAAPEATAASGSSSHPARMKSRFLVALEDLHRIAAVAARLAGNPEMAGRDTRSQLQFLGEENLKNHSAVENLMRMGQSGKAHYVNAGMTLNGLLPGVKITVLGPPTLEQSNSIRTERARDPQEFWQFCNFWTSRHLAMKSAPAASKRATEPPPGVRWFIRQTRRIQADLTLELVRELDTVLNNTSLILLLEAGSRKLLFPGDAQIENWAFALQNPEWRRLMADVNLYKVGHHGSRNATPKSLWALFRRQGDAQLPERLATLCSTRSGKHGSAKSGTEVPRRILVEELRAKSAFASTEEFKSELAKTFEIDTETPAAESPIAIRSGNRKP
jgi:beta-lactamase superfamily II metal-dependent hydrolase